MEWWRWVPVVNFVVELLNDLPMIPDRIEQFLSMFATIGTLMLGVAVSVPMSFTYEELEASSLRFSLNGSYPGHAENSGEFVHIHNGRNYGPSNWLAASATDAISQLQISLMITLGIYISMVITSFRDPYGERDCNLLKSWWSVIRFAIFGDTLFLIM